MLAEIFFVAGLDMGGVQKEFFQNIVERIFDPEVGMFEYNEDTRQFHINPLSLESQYVCVYTHCLCRTWAQILCMQPELTKCCVIEVPFPRGSISPRAPTALDRHEFELAGLLLGLAIYNGVILDVKLPLTLYKKLLGWGMCLIPPLCMQRFGGAAVLKRSLALT